MLLFSRRFKQVQETLMAVTTSQPVAPTTQNPGRWYANGFAIVALIVALRLLLHLLTANRYGIFRDELYYYACSQHMAWGYVDMPPFVPAVPGCLQRFWGRPCLCSA